MPNFWISVARVVQVELTGHIVTSPVQHGGQAVAQCAAAGVAHVHGAGGVGGNKLHVVLQALAEVGAAVLLVLAGGAHHVGEPAQGGVQVDEAGAGDLHPVKIGAGQLRQMGGDGLGNHAGSLAEGAGAGHGQVAGHVAVLRVGGDLHNKAGQLGLGQAAVGHGGLGGPGQQVAGLGQQRGAGVVIFITHSFFDSSEWFLRGGMPCLFYKSMQVPKGGGTAGFTAPA